jgi:TonB family protein
MNDPGQLLQSLWSGMALHLWQTTLVMLPICLLSLALRSAPAKYTQLLWWLLMLKLFLPLALLAPFITPVVNWLSGGSTAPPVFGQSLLFEYVSVVLHPAGFTADPVAGSVSQHGFVYTLTVLWIAGVLYLLSRWIRPVPTGAETMRSLDQVSRPLCAKIDAALAGTAIPRKRVLLDRNSRIPAMTGIFRPRIVIPERVVEELGVDELRAILLHEEGHCRRRDPLLALVQRCGLLIFFFYPPVWWLAYRLRSTSEIACDEAVLSGGIAPATYATALVRVFGMGLQPLPIGGAVGLGRLDGLEQRLQRIENSRRYRAMLKHRLIVVCAVLLIAGGTFSMVLFAGPSKPAVPAAALPLIEQETIGLADLRGLDKEIALDLQDVQLYRIFDMVEALVPVQIEVKSELSTVVSVEYEMVSIMEILNHLAKEYGLVYEVPDQHILIVRQPLLAGVGDVTNPMPIAESKVQPCYPEAYRKNRVEGRVILQAVIRKDGTVGSIETLRFDAAFPLFVDCAKRAVSQWKYEPAYNLGEPVDVFFTIFIEFKLS